MGSPDSATFRKTRIPLEPFIRRHRYPARVSGQSNEGSSVLMPDNTIAAPSCLDAPTTSVYDIATATGTRVRFSATA